MNTQFEIVKINGSRRVTVRNRKYLRKVNQPEYNIPFTPGTSEISSPISIVDKSIQNPEDLVPAPTNLPVDDSIHEATSEVEHEDDLNGGGGVVVWRLVVTAA